MCWEEDGVRERVLGGGWGEGACVAVVVAILW